MTGRQLHAFYADTWYLLRGSREIAFLLLNVLQFTLTPPNPSTLFVQHDGQPAPYREWGQDGLLIGLDAIRLEGSMRYHTSSLGSSLQSAACPTAIR